MKKSVIILLLGMLVVSLCACSGADSSKSLESEKVSESIAAVASESAIPEENTEPVTEAEIFTTEETETTVETEKPVSVEDVDAALQGIWEIEGGKVTFDEGSITILSQDGILIGSYEVNLSDATVDATMQATDGTLAIHMPFEYLNDVLKLWNNRNVKMTRLGDLEDEEDEWTASITAEVKNYAMQREEIEILVKLVGGSYSKTTTITFECVWPDGSTSEYCDEKSYTKGDEASAIITNDILYSGYDFMETPFTVNVYDDSWNMIGTFYDVASHWWSDED